MKLELKLRLKLQKNLSPNNAILLFHSQDTVNLKMSVRFKFKNDLEFSAIPCDGFHISVLDLKRAIIRMKRLGRVTDFDLDVINMQDDTPYESEDALISKNSSLVIVRRPLEAGKQKEWEEEKVIAGSATSASSAGSGGAPILLQGQLNRGGQVGRHDVQFWGDV